MSHVTVLKRWLVAPLAGARIEIGAIGLLSGKIAVAPLAGARIEMEESIVCCDRGFVAPLAGARIEIPYMINTSSGTLCRSPRGSED